MNRFFSFFQKFQLMTVLAILFLFSTDLSAQTWSQKGIDINGKMPFDKAGQSVSISSDGNTVAVGSPLSDIGSDPFFGHVSLFEWDGSEWIQKGLDIYGEAELDQSGCAISLSADGNTIAIGAKENDGNAENSGHVRIYEWTGINWTPKGLDLDGEGWHDFAGFSLELTGDGSTVVIGAYNNSSTATSSGQFKVYQWDGSSWIQKGTNVNGENSGDFFACSVSISSDGNTIAAGAIHNSNSGVNAGNVRVFEWNGTSWIQKGADISGENDLDASGNSVSISDNGNTLAISAQDNDGNGSESGQVRIFEWNGTSWIQKGLDIYGEFAQDRFGKSLSLSSDGNTVAIGANESADQCSYCGHVRVFKWNGVSWGQEGLDIDGEDGSWSGFSVDLSSDGNTLIIGGPNNGSNGDQSGHARVFEFSSCNQSDLPSATATTSDVILGNDGFIDLTVSNGTPPYTFSWWGPAGFTSSQEDLSGLSSGNYTVVIFDNDSCKINFEVDLDSTSSNGINSKENFKSEIEIFPNPSVGSFTVSSQFEIQELWVYDLRGQLQSKRTNVDLSSAVFDFNELPAGTYLLKIVTTGNLVSKKLMITN